jgi:hypothetical protein
MVLIFIRRKPGMSIEQFRAYYENHHRKLGEKIAPEIGMSHYRRRYLTPISGNEFEYDVVTEVGLKDQASFDAVVNAFARGDLAPEVEKDEQQFMDRSETRFLTFIECESKLGV